MGRREEKGESEEKRRESGEWGEEKRRERGEWGEEKGESGEKRRERGEWGEEKRKGSLVRRERGELGGINSPSPLHDVGSCRTKQKIYLKKQRPSKFLP